MPQQPEGRVVTFHSFTGGSGRTMAAANTAWILAAAGLRVLVADWDLESPGLHRYFHPFLDTAEFDRSGGVTDLLRRFERATVDPFAVTPPVTVHWPHFAGGIDLLPAGRQDAAYAGALGGLGGLDWDDFYRAGGGEFLDELRRHMTGRYDYTLIDSPAGVGDLAQICLAHLADDVLACFTLSAKSIEGAARAAAATREAEHPPRVLPVPMRVDPADRARAEAGRRAARERLAGLPAGLGADEAEAYWRDVQVPYQSAYAYEEVLAALTDLPGQPDSLLSAYERLAWYLTDGAVKGLTPADEGVRYRAAAQYLRLTTAREDRVLLRHSPEDRVWAEWIAETLAAAKVHVIVESGAPAVGAPREMIVISAGPGAAEAQRRFAGRAAGRPPLAVYTDSVAALPAFPEHAAARLAGLSEPEAARALLRLVGREEEPRRTGALRYPGLEPACFHAPPRPAAFTGRQADLDRLRDRLRPDEHGSPRPGPVVLHGLGGAGKSAIAAEYVHRFRAAYDLVWWLDCAALDHGLAELARALGVGPGAVLGALRRGEPHRRWLIVLDDADDYEQVRRVLPQGGGQAIITSRNLSWGGGFASVPVSVYGRDESIVYLRRHLPEITTTEADAVAEALGDLPLAVAAAAEALRAPGATIAGYLAELDRPQLTMPAVEGAFDRSLTRLRAQSPGAHRLLQLFSVLAPDTATGVVYSDAMAEVLKPYDESVADRVMPAALVQQISRLGLLRPDLPGGRIHMHPLLQRIVRERMTPEDRREARHQVHLVLAGLSRGHDVDDPRSWPQYELIWPHLDASAAAGCRNEAVRGLVVDRVRRLRHAGDTARGERLARQVEAEWAGTAHERQRLQLAGVRAGILRDQGRYTEALELDREVARAQERLLDRHHPATLATRDRLAADLRALGHYTDALHLARRTYRAWSRVVGAEHARTLNALNGLATAYRAAGHYRAARRCDERVRTFRPFPGPDRDPAVLRAAANMGRDLRDAGLYAESAALLRELEPACAAAFGDGSRAALKVRTSLAVSLRLDGRAAESAPLLEHAYEQFADAGGPAGPETLACRHSWGLTLLATGPVERARAELTGVADRYRDQLGPAHPRTVIVRANLALVDRDPEPAARAAADLAAALAANHPHALIAARNAALLAGGPTADLEQRLRRALGEGHPLIAVSNPTAIDPY
ncbi:FxSxx-COOH system tetratricopeptide repeat protein [Dactylosporangium matsuzakiense]|uniref:FxSxx-COOH system tetratricopeptide repeat protein n=1 Tax=Dactylosporangium matsuzakiense TaxID=53360 RepID=UPI0021C3525E|nr:FxSxx-COOH system tetratricopeptide repeat protein [Dactylosporangium matsuzakiense]UWZ42698.1 tetratricopeptide repeat protein [Dactylosporangium matsuzakiense]